MLPNNGMTLIITPPNLSIALISLSLIVIKALIIPTIATTR